jgi:hypothetical protein
LDLILLELLPPHNFMTDHELQLKAIALRQAMTGLAFQPEGLMEYSPGMREALPWVCVAQNTLRPEGVREPAASATALAPLQGALPFWALTQGSSRGAQTTLGCTLFALQATNHVALRRESRKRKCPRIPFRVIGVIRG